VPGNVNATQNTSATADCGAGKVAISGGYTLPSADATEDFVMVTENGPTPDGRGWTASISVGFGANAQTVVAHALCAAAPAP